MKIRFDSLSIGARFFDAWSDEPCVKASDTTARDAWCAPGFCFTVQADELVEVDLSGAAVARGGA